MNNLPAIKWNGIIYTGVRHQSIICTLQENGLIVENEIRGYVDFKNRFVREEMV